MSEPSFTIEQQFELRKLEAISKGATKEELEDLVMLLARTNMLQKQFMKQWMRDNA